MNKLIEQYNVPTMCGNSHRYKSKKGEISLINIPFLGGIEIMCIDGDLEMDCEERYGTIEGAEKRIEELLI